MQKKKIDRSCPVESSTSIFRIPLLISFTQLKLQDDGEDIWWYIYIYIWGSNEAPRMILGYHRGRLVTYPQYPAVFSNLLLQGPAKPRGGMSTFLAIMALFSHVSHFLHRALYLYCTADRHLIPFRRFGTSDANSTCIPRLHQHLLKLVHGRTKLY